MARRKKQRNKPTKPLDRGGQTSPPPPARRWRLPGLLAGVAAIVIVALAWFAITRPAATRTTDSDPPGSSGSETVDAGHRSRADSVDRLAGQLLAMPEPDQDGWESEVLHQTSNAQLKQLAKLFEKGGGQNIQPSQLSGIVAKSFSCGPLVPGELNEVFRDRALVVRRAVNGRQPPLAPPYKGREEEASPDKGGEEEALPHNEASRFQGRTGLAEALDELGQRLVGPSDVHAKFKQFRIEPRNDSFVTTVLFEASGHTADGSAQLNTRWDCLWTRGTGKNQPPLLSSIQVRDYEEAIAHSPSQTLLADCTAAALGANPCYQEQLGRGMGYWLERIESHFGLIVDGSYGLAVGDVNEDGLEDVYLGQPGGLPNRLLIQNSDGTVTDQSAASGADVLDDCRSALLVDLNNDGHQDLVLAAARKLLVFSGDGQASFTLRAEKDGHFQFALAAADYDMDGDLDFYVCNYTRQAGLDAGRFGVPIPYHNATNGGRNLMFRNDGDWEFTDVTAESGLDVNNNRWSFASAWEDFDNDGDLDLYIANDFGHNNLYRNDPPWPPLTKGGSSGDVPPLGKGGPGGVRKFTDISEQANAVDANFGMSVAWGDYNRDGWMDIYISNMFSSAGNRVTFQDKFKQRRPLEELELLQRLARGNTLLRNTGNSDAPGFQDVSDQATTTMGRWSWGSLFADINNDGWQDLLITNGFLTQDSPDDL